MGVRDLALAALGVVASGCLDTPAGSMLPDDGQDLLPPDVNEAADAAPACADAFAVAYINRFDVDPAGGSFEDMLVIVAIGDAVGLNHLEDGADDSLQLELAMSAGSLDPLPAGAVSGELASAAADMIIGPLVDQSDWTQKAKPAFRLDFSNLGEGEQPPHDATARLTIGDSAVDLDFTITYGGQDDVVPLGAAIVYSGCGE